MMWDDGAKYGTSPGICDIYVHQPISTTEFNIDDSDILKDRIFEQLTVNYIQNEYR